MTLSEQMAVIFRGLAAQRPFELVVDDEPPHDPQRREILPLQTPCMYCGAIDEWEFPLSRWGAVMAPVCRRHLPDAEELNDAIDALRWLWAARGSYSDA